MLSEILILIFSLFVVLKGASVSAESAARLASKYRVSKYATGFIIVAVISILPETFIAVNSALAGEPSLGLGTLFGSNVADLTVVFAAIVLISGRGIKVESRILKNRLVYPMLLFLPLLLGLDGYFSRLEGVTLVLAGGIFYYIALRDGRDASSLSPLPGETAGDRRPLTTLLFGLAAMLSGAYFVVSSASGLASRLGVSPVLIGMLVVGLGTTLPEFLFSLKSALRRDDSLAVGDILGTVLADATVVVGILALLSPFSFPSKVVYLTGAFMVAASFLLFNFMRSGRSISRQEAVFLLLFWVFFVLVEFLVNR